jgi:hypothetical protein
LAPPWPVPLQREKISLPPCRLLPSREERDHRGPPPPPLPPCSPSLFNPLLEAPETLAFSLSHAAATYLPPHFSPFSSL